jgi:hypothetical protein
MADKGQFELLVADAQRQFDVNGKVQNLSFWSYKVMCRSFLPGYQNPPLFQPIPDPAKAPNAKPTNYIDSGAGYVDYCGWHRYSDFEWLAENLAMDHPGEIFPPLPPKENDATKDKMQDLVSNKDNDNPKLVPFVQDRIRHLNMFLQVIMEMKNLHETPHLKAFLAMEEHAWHAYKEQVKNSRHGTGMSAVASKVSSFFGRVTHKNVVVYDATSDLGRIRQAQDDFAASMKMCQYRLKDIAAHGTTGPKTLANLDEFFVPNAGKPLAYPMVMNGHFVATETKQNGVVKHVDQFNYAYVEWSAMDNSGNMVPDGRGLERVPTTALRYPSSGICDPAIFAMTEAVGQLESFFAYIQHRAETRDLERLIDLVGFWKNYAENVGDAIKRLSDLENKHRSVAHEAAGIKESGKKEAKAAEAAQLSREFDTAEQAFKKNYAYLFRRLQRKGLFNINLLIGKVCYNLLNDDDWPKRLARCDKALEPNFDVPAEVTAMLDQLASGHPVAPIIAPIASPNLNFQAFGSSANPVPTPTKRESSAAVTESSPAGANADEASPPRHGHKLARNQPAEDSSDESEVEAASHVTTAGGSTETPSPRARAAPKKTAVVKEDDGASTTEGDDA